MKITNIEAQNVLGARSIRVRLTKPVGLFAGKNGAGKSSLQEAVRMALTGESVRVGLKKDYGALVTEGQDSGFVEVATADGTLYSVVLPAGKGVHCDIPELPFVLDAQRFARMDDKERRTFLFGLMGVKMDAGSITSRMTTGGCDAKKVEQIAPFLRSGFDAAHKEAQAKARDEKAAWRTITGETYGDKKAASWAAEKPVFDAAELADLQQRLAATDAGLAAANQRMGALQADHKRHAEAAQRLADLREKGSRYARVADKLVRDEAELKEWEAKVEDARQRAAGGRKVGLVHDLARALFDLLDTGEPCTVRPGEDPKIDAANHALNAYEDEHGSIKSSGGDHIEARNKLPEYEKALHLLQSSVANDKRDLAEADAAAKAIAELEAAVGSAPDEAEIHAARKHLDDLKAERSDITAKLAGQQDAERQAKQAGERTAKALAAHESVLAWIAIADALAPNGIPGELLAEALEPINDRLLSSAGLAEWPPVIIGPDMRISYGERDYALISESERWRADAMIAEAVSFLSGIKLLVLDRFDVLDLKGREDLMFWLDGMAQDGDIETALIFGTLKALPALNFETIEAHWLESGAAGQLQEAA